MITNLPRSLYVVLLIVKQYIDDTGRESFTYNNIKVYAAREGLYRKYSITDRTLDRALRKLAEMEYFQREYYRKKRIVVYRPTPRFWIFLEERRQWLVRKHG